MRPEDFFRATVPFLGPMFASHIIRTAPDDRYCENCQFNEPTNIVPGSAFEVPWGSGHLYISIWAHQVGAGFPNHHARIYVARWLDVPSTQPPLFRGWI